MDVIIKKAADELMLVFVHAGLRVSGRGTTELVDLEHRCQDLERDEEFTRRTAAHIVRAAALLELERRKGD